MPAACAGPAAATRPVPPAGPTQSHAEARPRRHRRHARLAGTAEALAVGGTGQANPGSTANGLFPFSTASKQGTPVSLWSNKTERVKCGETADADVEYRLPELLPYQTHSFTVKLPYTSAAITPGTYADPRVFFDSTRGRLGLPVGTSVPGGRLDSGGGALHCKLQAPPGAGHPGLGGGT